MNARQRKKFIKKASHHSFRNFKKEVIDNYAYGLLWNGQSWYLNGDVMHRRYMTSIHMVVDDDERKILKEMYINAIKAINTFPTKILGKRLYK